MMTEMESGCLATYMLRAIQVTEGQLSHTLLPQPRHTDLKQFCFPESELQS